MLLEHEKRSKVKRTGQPLMFILICTRTLSNFKLPLYFIICLPQLAGDPLCLITANLHCTQTTSATARYLSRYTRLNYAVLI